MSVPKLKYVLASIIAIMFHAFDHSFQSTENFRACKSEIKKFLDNGSSPYKIQIQETEKMKTFERSYWKITSENYLSASCAFFDDGEVYIMLFNKDGVQVEGIER